MKDKKKPSTRATGLAFQRWIRDWLIERDYTAHNLPPCGKMIFSKGKKFYVSTKNDIFGCDLIAKKSNQKTLWIQATKHKSLKLKQQEILKYIWNLNIDDVQIWIKRDSGTIDIYYLKYPIDYKHLIDNVPQETIDALMKTCGDYFQMIGKIIRRKFYQSEGITYDY